MHLAQHILCTRTTELALELKVYLDVHTEFTWPWRWTLTNSSDVAYVFPRYLLLSCANTEAKCFPGQRRFCYPYYCFSVSTKKLGVKCSSSTPWWFWVPMATTRGLHLRRRAPSAKLTSRTFRLTNNTANWCSVPGPTPASIWSWSWKAIPQIWPLTRAVASGT